MSRIQKKKPVSEKKKQKAEQGKENGSNVEKPVGQKAVFSSKSEKNAVDAKVNEPNFFQKSMDFLREVKVELKKVTWPTREQTTQTTIVVIIFVFIIAGFLGIFDFGLSKLVQIVLT